eukprot:c20497_g1_i1 orf=180-1970(+)
MEHHMVDMQYETTRTSSNSAVDLISGREESNGQLIFSDIQRKEFLGIVHMLLEAQHQSGSSPFPVLLGGKEVDLFNLSLQVRANGGYESATANSMWSIFAEELGFGEECGPGLKLVYVKYLQVLENWTHFFGKEERNTLHSYVSPTRVNLCAAKCSENKWFSNWEHMKKFIGISQSGAGSFVKVVGRQLISRDNSTLEFSGLYQGCDFSESHCKRRWRGERSYLTSLCQHSVDDLVGRTHVSTLNGNGTFANVLEWIKRIALNPGDLKMGQGSRGSKQDETWVEECATQARRIRACLWKKKECFFGYSQGDSSLGLTMEMLPPSLYYQELPKPDKQALERLRATQKRAEQYRYHYLACLKADQTSITNPGVEGGQIEEPSAFLIAMNEMIHMGDLLNAQSRKRIPIGSDFQAHVPLWIASSQTGLVECPEKIGHHTSDKWLGTVSWPLQGCKRVVNKKRIGKGRFMGCSCIHPQSFECVKLHVQTEREKLKSELGDAFDGWGFSNMGEMVSESWSQEEELAFKLIAKMNPISSGKNFWDELLAAFPSKHMSDLVNYYFNVFVLRRRAIQNRIMPESIDSDDDEADLTDMLSEDYKD